METINFLFKIRKLVNNRTKENRYMINVFNPMECYKTTIYLYDDDLIKGYSLSESVKYHLQNEKRFFYKNYQSYFCNCDDIGF